jgi:putative aminopeptidase FrvX
MDSMEKYLRDMMLTPALSGHEQKMAAYMEHVFTGLGLETFIDTFGNCIAKVPGTDPKAPKMMIFSHMDQLGFLVRRIEEDGFIRIERLGGIPEKVLPATPVQIQSESGDMVDGLIGVKSHHVTPVEEKYVVDTYMNLYVDIGATSRKQVVDLGIEVGAPVVYKPQFMKMQDTRIYGTSVDNRAGCTVMLEVAHKLKEKQPKATVYIVGSVQEEHNLRGAMMAARSIKPDIAVSVDGGGASDTPDLQGRGEISLGNGPTMSLYNFHGRGTLNGTIPHPAMVKHMQTAAKKANIFPQRGASIGGLTDLAYVQLEGTGVRSIDIGPPVRYAHSPIESCDLRDIENTANLLAAFLYEITSETAFTR